MKTILRAASIAAGVGLLASAPLSAQFRKYVANGDSITAGVEGNCLVERHQQKSFPKIVAAQLGLTDFQTPLVGETRTVTSPAAACLGAVVAGNAISVGPVSQPTAPKNTTLARPYDNLGLPGARAADLVNLRVADPAGNTVNRSAALALRNFLGGPFEGRNAVDETNLLAPDLVTLWIGANDVLGAALSGVALEGVTLTPLAAFTAKYNEVMTGLRASGRTLVALNVPDVAAVPFTTTVPAIVVNPATRQPVLVGGQPVPLLGPRTSTSCGAAPCPVPSGTLVTIQALPLLSQGVGIPVALGGTGLPLPDGGFTPPTLNAGVLLYPDEVAAIRARTNEINGAIASSANSSGAILVDVHGIFEDIKAHGYEIPGLGLTLTPAFLSGGIFSADGFHPNNIAHAIIADEIIQALNETRDLSIERPDFADALFFPDEPPVTPTFVTPADMLRGLLGIFPPVEEGIEILLPSLESRPAPVLVRRKRGRG